MTDTYRVLVVEDDPSLAKVLAEFLRVTGSFNVDQAATIKGLWSRLQENPYDIVLMDYQLPDGTGIDVLTEIVAKGYSVPVIMLTGKGDERTAVQSIQLGAADYVLKRGDYLISLPALIRKTVRAHRLQLSVDRSLEQIRYQATLLNNVRDAIVVWDLEGRITYWNFAAAALFGFQASERLGLPVEEFYLPVFNPPIRVPRPGDTVGRHVERLYQVSGKQPVWVSSRITTLYDTKASNQVIGYMDVSHDVTRHKEAEQALRAERNFVSAVLDTVGALVVVLDQEGRIVRFNRACEQITGYSFAEVKGMCIWDRFVAPEEIGSFKAHFQSFQGGKLPDEHENFWLTRSGERRLITWSNTALTNRQGEVEYVIATGIDVTEQRKAEQALRESEARYRAIVEDYQTELICRFTPDGTLTFTNEVTCRYFGKSREELVGGNIFSFLPEGERPALIQHLASFCLSHPIATLEHQTRLPSQELRWQQRTDRAIFDEQGQVFEFQSVGRDITARKQMEAQIQAAQTHLTQAARLAVIGELASGVAHQINNPLTTVIADSQILLRTLSEEHPGWESAEAIVKAGWRLQEAVQRLLEFSRPASATLETLLINQTIQRALHLVGAHIEAAGISLEYQLSDGLSPLRGNARQLEDLWVNLLLLARDALVARDVQSARTALSAPGPVAREEAPRIQIHSRPGESGSVIVEVQDNGLPLPSSQLDTIFEPNFVGANHGRGTGMELSICREIVRQHRGHIAAESNPERDTIFRVILYPEQGNSGFKSGNPALRNNRAV